MLPLIALGLGLLAGNQWLGGQIQDSRRQALADRYAGLLGAAPGPMGPPDEQGNMGYSGGRGLLADPTDPQRQLQFAAGVTQIPGQVANGLNLLNAAFQRAQQGSQFQQTFQQTGEQNRAQQANWDRTYEASRQDAQTRIDEWNAEQKRLIDNAATQAQQWNKTFGLQQEEFGLRQKEFDQRLKASQQGLLEPPKLPVGYGYVPAPDGSGAVAAPMRGTPEYAKAMDGKQALQATIALANQMQDMIEGKETTTPQGNRVRVGGVGSEMTGENAQKYSLLRGQLVSALGQANAAGVLQEGEYKRYADMLPDPTSITSYLRSNKTLGTGYEEFGKQLRTKLTNHYKANPWMVPDLPAGFVPAGSQAGAVPVGRPGLLQ